MGDQVLSQCPLTVKDTSSCYVNTNLVTHTHTRLTALCPRLPRWAGTRKVKPIWILLKQETVSGSSISWAICKSPPCSKQITMPAPHHSVFYRPDALPAAQPTVSKHWRQSTESSTNTNTSTNLVTMTKSENKLTVIKSLNNQLNLIYASYSKT